MGGYSVPSIARVAWCCTLISLGRAFLTASGLRAGWYEPESTDSGDLAFGSLFEGRQPMECERREDKLKRAKGHADSAGPHSVLHVATYTLHWFWKPSLVHRCLKWRTIAIPYNDVTSICTGIHIRSYSWKLYIALSHSALLCCFGVKGRSSTQHTKQTEQTRH